jgi:hypothetical protein
MHHALLLASSVPDAQVEILAAAADITLDPISDMVIRLLASLFGAFLAFRLFKYWATTSWAMIAVEILAAIVLSLFILTPDTGIALLGDIRGEITGGP